MLIWGRYLLATLIIKMKKFLFFLLLSIMTKVALSQNLGYEMRTNGKSYLTSSYKGFELRHRTDLQENRFTYRYNLHKENKVYLSVPLHYKIEKNHPTLEPRVICKFDKFNIWIQQEFWYHEIDNFAIAIDVPSSNKKMKYRVGWDNSNTVRFRLTVNI